MMFELVKKQEWNCVREGRNGASEESSNDRHGLNLSFWTLFICIIFLSLHSLTFLSSFLHHCSILPRVSDSMARGSQKDHISFGKGEKSWEIKPLERKYWVNLRMENDVCFVGMKQEDGKVISWDVMERKGLKTLSRIIKRQPGSVTKWKVKAFPFVLHLWIKMWEEWTNLGFETEWKGIESETGSNHEKNESEICSARQCHWVRREWNDGGWEPKGRRNTLHLSFLDSDISYCLHDETNLRNFSYFPSELPSPSLTV